nr:hypothetical protein B0A51_00667 [Rachicladosporium sp. CCFEE 5018]
MDILTSFPPMKALGPEAFDKQITAYLTKLDKLPTAAFSKAKDGKSPLDVLSPSSNSIPYIYCLLEATKSLGKDKAKWDELLSKVTLFYATFDSIQMRYVGQAWVDLWKWTAECLDHLGIIDVSVLSSAILRLDPSAATFTSLHLRFVRLCLGNNTPSQALPILDREIYAFPHANAKNVLAELPSEELGLSNAYINEKSLLSEKLRPDLVMEYYLLGAQVYIGTRALSRARLFLELVILHPAQNHATSALQVEAFQKWLLIGLLTDGKPFPYPRTMDQSMIKALRSMSKAYEALTESFERRDSAKYYAEMDAGQQIWAENGNYRLVAEAGQTLMQYRVSDLQKTYAALPVSRVAYHLGMASEDTLSTLDNMIRTSSLDATLTPRTAAAEAVLRFNMKAPGRSQGSVDVEIQTKRIEELIAAVRDADKRLELTKEHIDITKRNKRTGTDAELADQMDLSWDTPSAPAGVMVISEDDAEEDIMA